MHFTLAINTTSDMVVKKRIEDNITTILSEFKYVRVFPFLYIIEVDSEPQREDIRLKLVDLAKIEGPHLHFVVSPTMNGGKYNGWLPSTIWESINRISN